MEKNELRETRKQMFAKMEQRLQEMHPKEEDRMFYYHSSEDRIVLSHALFWVMTQPQCLKGKIRKEKFFLLLRQYQEEMLDAFLMEDDYFPELLRYCNILYEMLPTILMSPAFRTDKDARKLAAIAVVAAGYGGDMDEELCNELLDDMDFHYNKVKCRKIEWMLPKLMGMVEGVPQNENTPFHPYSPYAVAKQYGFWIVKEYREAYNMYCCSGILFNHESERRGETFVTRKITLAAARISQGVQDCLYLGNMDSLRDWGYAKDYVECMWLILQQEKPEDFVIATGVQHSVREFTDLAFKHAGIELKFEGEGINEVGIVVNGPEGLVGKTVVRVSEDFYRPTDVVNLWGDPTKAKAKLKWNPNKTSFEDLVRIMVESDVAKVAAEGAAAKVRTNLAEYLEKGIVK